MQRLQGSALYADALVRLGDCMIAKRDLDSAQTLLTGASRDPKAEPKMEEIQYKLTEIAFFEGNFEAALEGYNRVIADFPKGFYVNNSLERTILIGEHQDLDRPLLATFAEALLEKAQGKTESAISKLDGLISAKAEKLSDLAQMEKAKIYKEEKKYSESLKALNKLLEEYPQSFLCPQAQMMVGDLYNYHLNDRNKAIEAYQKLLKEYDRSVYVDQVRDRLRELKAEISPPSSG
ncbi:MAG: tetratricopeptide repeat protein [candidate division Zixibacteria bacterium]|nr:tetratricopeptide repeat protein [candidate division Zixibacteria bacterium]